MVEAVAEQLKGLKVTTVRLAEKVLTRGANQSASLAETLYRYFAIDLDKSQRAKFTKKWDGIWSDELVDYALSDVIHLPLLMREQLSSRITSGKFTYAQQVFGSVETVMLAGQAISGP